MQTFGEKLRAAMESRGLRHEEVARASGLDVEQVKALERGDHDALPGIEKITDGLHRFARLVEVEPDEVIADYLKEREDYFVGIASGSANSSEGLPPVDAPATPPRSEHRPMPVEPAGGERVKVSSGTGEREQSSGMGGVMAVAAVVLVAVVALAAWWLRNPQPQPTATEPAPAAPAAMPETATPAPMPAAAADEAPTPEPAVKATPAETAPVEAPPVQAAAPMVSTSGAAINQSGVGTGVVDHQLVGETDTFPLGSRVWFWTQVEGAAGTSLRHVWIHDGEEVLSVPLRIGGSRWRTQSYKTMHPGSGGRWVVEARDAGGRVLARSEFRCVEPGA